MRGNNSTYRGEKKTVTHHKAIYWGYNSIKNYLAKLRSLAKGLTFSESYLKPNQTQRGVGYKGLGLPQICQDK